MKKIFANKLCQWAFARLHPNFGIGLANFLSQSSRKAKNDDIVFTGEKEWLSIHANEVNAKAPHDFYVFGHRHLPIDYTLADGKARYINLGDWMNYNSFAVYDGQQLKIAFFENENGKIYS